jgi:hypothetical protein
MSFELRGFCPFPRFAFWSVAAAIGAVSLASACSPNAVCKLGGPINDPSNRTLRRNIMSYGLGQFCEQMITRNAPLTLAPDPSVVGRFFPQHCAQQVLDNGDLWVHFDGFGYAFTSLSRKVTFTSAATIQYNQDFKCADDSSIYAYFDTRTASPPDFQLGQIEQPMANLVQGWIKPFADSFGQQMVSGQIGQGFTVIQDPSGSTDFTVGHLPLGQRPFHPIDAHGNDRVTYENLRTAVHAGERDFIGPIKIDGSGRALFLQMHVDAPTPIDVFVVPKFEGDPSLQLYTQYPAAGPLAYPPRTADVVQPGTNYQRTVPLGAGMYYVIIDNTASAGQVQPAPALFGVVGDTPAVVSYAIQIGDAP